MSEIFDPVYTDACTDTQNLSSTHKQTFSQRSWDEVLMGWSMTSEASSLFYWTCTPIQNKSWFSLPLTRWSTPSCTVYKQQTRATTKAMSQLYTIRLHCRQSGQRQHEACLKAGAEHDDTSHTTQWMLADSIQVVRPQDSSLCEETLLQAFQVQAHYDLHPIYGLKRHARMQTCRRSCIYRRMPFQHFKDPWARWVVDAKVLRKQNKSNKPTTEGLRQETPKQRCLLPFLCLSLDKT